MRIYFGSQVENAGEGVFACDFDPATGQSGAVRAVAGIERPTWLARHPALPVLYAVSEVGNRDAREGRLHALRIQPDGSLEPRGDVSAHGGGPTDFDIDPAGKALYVANFGGGQALAVALGDDGALLEKHALVQHDGSGPHRRQTKSHPHGVTRDPTGNWLLVPDMGADRLFVHGIGVDGVELEAHAGEAVATPAGSGPRLVFFGADGRFAYMLTELSAELLVYGWDAVAGGLSLVQSLPLDREAYEGEPSAAALVLSADGRHLYASNRRTHTVEAFAIDAVTGRLEHFQSVSSGGEKPWAFSLSPDGKWLACANQASDLVQFFERDDASGMLQAGPTVAVPSPTCISFPVA